MNKLCIWSLRLLIIFSRMPVAQAAGFLQGELTEFKHTMCLNDHKTCISIAAETAVSSQLKALFVLNQVKADLSLSGKTEHIEAKSAFLDFEMNQVVFNIEKKKEASQRIINLADLSSRVLK